MNMEIEKFKEEYLGQIKEIANKSFPEPKSSNFFKKYSDDYFIVALINNKVVGFFIAQGEHAILLAVDPAYRHHGIGKKLMEYVEKRFSYLYLRVREHNKVAINLYKELGWKIKRKIERYYKNGDNAIEMEYHKK